MEAFNIDLDRAFECVILIGLAYLFSLPIGWDREKQVRSAGLRTFPLVAVSSCAFMVIASGFNDMQVVSRAFQGVVTGLGFVGGGAILKKDDKVEGMSTAVSIWLTGAIGVSCGIKRFEIAFILMLVCLLSLKYGKGEKNK